jgi:glucose/arabinose dehydrogenase
MKTSITKNLTLILIALALITSLVWIYSTYHAEVLPPNPEGTATSTGKSGGEVNGADATTTVAGFTVPEGFVIEVFADGIKDARVMAFDPKGRLLVSQPSEGKIASILNTDGDQKADSINTLVSGLNVPHGMAFHCPDSSIVAQCHLYVAENNALQRFDYDAEKGTVSNKKKLLSLPGGSLGLHFTRSLLFLPSPQDDTLLISVGSSCNACAEKEEARGAITAYNIQTGSSTIYAKGLRNAVFMTLNPVDGKVFATEMGRDNLGDNIPPDEINIIEKGKNYGWPICYGKNIHDTVYDKNTYIRNPCMEPFETGSFIDLQAHSAPLGLDFIPEEGWPEDMWYDMLVAFHGSWNRSVPTGYKIVRLKMDAKGNYAGTEDFITGWDTKGGKQANRPADIKVMPGGVILISDDAAGIIYRVSRKS